MHGAAIMSRIETVNRLVADQGVALERVLSLPEAGAGGAAARAALRLLNARIAEEINGLRGALITGSHACAPPRPVSERRAALAEAAGHLRAAAAVVSEAEPKVGIALAVHADLIEHLDAVWSVD